MDALAIIFIILGTISFLVGFVGSVMPILAGPPFTAFGNIFIQIAVIINGNVSSLSWFLCIFSVIIGGIMTVADFLAPTWIEKLGSSSKTSSRYAMFGVIAAFFLSCTGGGPLTVATAGIGAIPTLIVGTLTMFAFAYIGGRYGELEELPPHEPNRVAKAHKAGLAHMASVMLTTVGKIVYSFFGCGLALGQFFLT